MGAKVAHPGHRSDTGGRYQADAVQVKGQAWSELKIFLNNKAMVIHLIFKLTREGIVMKERAM